LKILNAFIVIIETYVRPQENTVKIIRLRKRIDVREKPDETILVISLYATYDDEDENEVKDLAKSYGYYYKIRTTYHGNYALKFVRRDKNNNW